MGPPEFTGGNYHPIWTTRPLAGLASMGPPEFTGGNNLLSIGSCCSSFSFNGAAGIHRRKLHGFDGVNEIAGNRFNGAAGIHRRKHTASLVKRANEAELQWGRRNSPAETRTCGSWSGSATIRFNGAAGIHRRKLEPAPQCAKPWFAVLQWGRRNSPAETSDGVDLVRPGALASMGPPEFTGGNLGAFHYHMTSESLQWGRRNSPAETGVGGTTVPAGSLALQWGRRNSPAETRSLAVSAASVAVTLQWGRRNSPAETRGREGRPGSRHPASMGPPEFTGGNDSVQDVSETVELVLQWGRRNSPAETRRRVRTRIAVRRRFNGAAGIHRRKRSERDRGPDRCRNASMGPPEFTGGNGRCCAQSTSTTSTLQWGRRNSPAETCMVFSLVSGWTGFNGAAGIHRRKLDREPPYNRPAGRFNGAAGIHRRKPPE